MSLMKVFDVAGSALNAQSVRLNVVASNLANADSVAASPELAYRARHPVFRTVLQDAAGGALDAAPSAGVRVLGVWQSTAAPVMRHEPGHPLADADGNVWASNVNVVEEMANMISASRAFQTNVEVINTSRDLLLRTLSMGS
ncbi:MAG TPA: flagellar basal body rod protein FlgC [Steroidobacteraceae bacterium]|jgi:flagellar basal-body rod protein FlgC|nr:flagellar basal body rod protein FlgC [Steroidobacteraceae bacterium]